MKITGPLVLPAHGTIKFRPDVDKLRDAAMTQVFVLPILLNIVAADFCIVSASSSVHSLPSGWRFCLGRPLWKARSQREELEP